MAESTRRKKLDKRVVDVPRPMDAKAYCCRCGTAYTRKKGFFPVSHSPLYRGAGYLPFCNECVEEMFQYYLRELGNDRDAMRRMCMKMDLYWNEDIYSMVEKSSGMQSRVRKYIGKTNAIRYIDKTFDDTIEEDRVKKRQIDSFIEDEIEETTGIQETDEIIEVPEDVMEFWGSGYSPSMYMELEQRRNYWMSKFPDSENIDIGTEALIRQICSLELDINRDRAAGKAVDKTVNALNTLLGSAMLKPNQKNEVTDSSLDKTPFGVWIKRWEDQRPIPEPDPEMKDVDGIVRYVDTWLRGHLAKMLGLKNCYSKLYDDKLSEMRIERPEFNEDEDEVVFNEWFGEADE